MSTFIVKNIYKFMILQLCYCKHVFIGFVDITVSASAISSSEKMTPKIYILILVDVAVSARAIISREQMTPKFHKLSDLTVM